MSLYKTTIKKEEAMKTQSDLTVLIKQIAYDVCLINVEELTLIERKIAKRLEKEGYIKLVDRDDYQEYQRDWSI
jgi:hypothetical protein